MTFQDSYIFFVEIRPYYVLFFKVMYRVAHDSVKLALFLEGVASPTPVTYIFKCTQDGTLNFVSCSVFSSNYEVDPPALFSFTKQEISII